MIVGAGVLAISFDAVLIRLAAADGWTVAFWRGGFIALSVGVLAAVAGCRFRAGLAGHGGAATASSFLFAATGLLFVLSVMHTRAANTVVIVSAAPLFAAFFTRVFLAEVVHPRTWMAIGAAFAGVVVVFYGSLGGGGWLGDSLALLAAVLFAANHTLLRRYPDLPRLPLVCASGLLTALLALPFAQPFDLGWHSYGWLALMGLVQMPTAMVLMAVGTRYLPAPEVGLFLLLEALLGPLWVWLGVGEEPPAATFAGGVLIVATLGAHAWLGLRESRRLRRAPLAPP